MEGPWTSPNLPKKVVLAGIYLSFRVKTTIPWLGPPNWFKVGPYARKTNCKSLVQSVVMPSRVSGEALDQSQSPKTSCFGWDLSFILGQDYDSMAGTSKPAHAGSCGPGSGLASDPQCCCQMAELATLEPSNHKNGTRNEHNTPKNPHWHLLHGFKGHTVARLGGVPKYDREAGGGVICNSWVHLVWS